MDNKKLQSQILDQLNANTYQLNRGWYMQTYHKHYMSRNMSPELLDKRIKRDINSRIIASIIILIVLINLIILLFGHVNNPDFVSHSKLTLFLSVMLLVILVSQIYTIICFYKLRDIYRFNSFLQKIYPERDTEE
jgi:amino acid transporter